MIPVRLARLSFGYDSQLLRVSEEEAEFLVEV